MGEVKDTSKDSNPRLIKRHLVEVVKVSDEIIANVTFEETNGVIVLLDALSINGIWNRKNPKDVLKTFFVMR
jgi:hypothetical protein